MLECPSDVREIFHRDARICTVFTWHLRVPITVSRPAQHLQCWAGQSSTLATQNDHLAYPTDGHVGANCPSTSVDPLFEGGGGAIDVGTDVISSFYLSVMLSSSRLS